MSEKTDIVERLLDQSWDRDGAWNAVSRKLTECLEAADEITRLRSDLKEALEALAWYVEHDDTNETLPHNAFYIEGRNKVLSVLKKARGEA